jgi:tRNA1(Val) A37 N6-methylase TrmN6
VILDVTRDGFLDNRIRVQQPRRGFRAGHDSVLLAAAVPARPGDSVLELGAGAGVASLCLAARVPECRILGVEQDPALVALANDNAKSNGLADRVVFVAGDARSVTPHGAPFDQIFFNPPFHPAGGQKSQAEARDRAMRDSDDAVSSWTRRAASLARPGGSITVILRADRQRELQGDFPARSEVLSLLPRAGEPAKRVIVRLTPGMAAQTLCAELVLHEDDGRPTRAAEAVLRNGAALPFDYPFRALSAV